MEDILTQLATAIGSLNTNVQVITPAPVPAPIPFNGTGSVCVDEFFVSFERYANSLYNGDDASYLQTLPSHLEGEPRNIALAYGTGSGVTYQNVKDKLIAEYGTKQTIGSNPYTDFFSLSRRKDESLTCFGIRLNTMASKIPHANADAKDMMVVSKFMAGLTSDVAQQVNLQLSTTANPTLDQIIKVANILEGQNGGQKAQRQGMIDELVTGNIAAASQMSRSTDGSRANVSRKNDRGLKCFACSSDEHLIKDCPVAKARECYNCHGLGHLSKHCLQPRKPRASESPGLTVNPSIGSVSN